MIIALGGDRSNSTTMFRWYRELQRGNFSLEERPVVVRKTRSAKKKIEVVFFKLSGIVKHVILNT